MGKVAAAIKVVLLSLSIFQGCSADSRYCLPSGYQTSKRNVSRFAPLCGFIPDLVISVDELVTTAAKTLSHMNTLVMPRAKL
jgi:hypothetical protein